jgi:hypothetical protein
LAVELPAGGFGELVELFGFEQFIEPGVEGVAGLSRQLLFGAPQCLLTDPLLACSQRHTQFYEETFSASHDFSMGADFNHGLLVLLCHRRRAQHNGQHGSRPASTRATRIRRVAIECGL